MNEQAARDVALVRAIETSDTDARLLTADDRRYAGRAAAELAHWTASQERAAATPERFVAKRAELLLDKITASEPAVRVLRTTRWRPWIGIVLPLVALALGLLAEQVTDRQHINVLAFPLMAIIAWNLAVYLLLALRPLLGRGPGPIRRLLHRAVAGAAGSRIASGGGLFGAAEQFALGWSAASGPLLAARAARVLHIAAALFALGAIAGLYLRAVAFEYRIGWESTYLQAATVHGILKFVLGPAAALLGMPFPSVESVAAMRLTGGTGGTDAASWIHLYAVTVALAVIVPRLLLAAWARWRERQFADAFPLDLSDTYFRRVLAAFAPTQARVRIAPYSYTLDESEVAGLQALARHLFGESAQLALRANTPFGSEDDAARGLASNETDVPLTLAVLNASATPENENHGRFLDTLRAAIGSPVAVVVDSAPYRERLGAQAGADERLRQRCEAWKTFAAQRALAATCVDLASPDLAAAERDLSAALGKPA